MQFVTSDIVCEKNPYCNSKVVFFSITNIKAHQNTSCANHGIKPIRKLNVIL